MEKLRIVWVILALLLASAAWVSAGQQGELPAVEVDFARMALVDGSIAADIAPDEWQPLDRHVLAGATGPYWVRFDLDLHRSGVPETALALRLSMRAASEVFWDGRLLGRNGRVGGSADAEVPGRIDWTVPLPAADVDRGPHQLLIRASSFQQGFSPYQAELGFQIAPVDVLYGRIYARWLVAAIALGGVAVSGLYFVAIRRARQRTAPVGERLLMLLALVGILLPVTEGWRALVGYSYDFHPLRLYLLLGLTALASALLPAYLHVRFSGPPGRGVVVIFALLMLAIVLAVPSLDARSLLLHLLGLVTSVLVVLRARDSADSDRYAVLALLVTTLGLLLIARNDFLDGLYFIALAVLMAFLLFRHAQRLSGLDEKIARLQAQRSRLSAELLKRSIHPHWLMNTLTSLQELVEVAPGRASQMIELLAEQFARMRELDERSLIPLREEIALCRNHLDVVGIMHGRDILFAVDGNTDTIDVPPGLLHALVENALTHAGVAACTQSGFRLLVGRYPQTATVELRAAHGKGGNPAIVERTGTRFVRASLAAAYPVGATFEHAGDGRYWNSRIEVPCAS